MHTADKPRAMIGRLPPAHFLWADAPAAAFHALYVHAPCVAAVSSRDEIGSLRRNQSIDQHNDVSLRPWHWPLKAMRFPLCRSCVRLIGRGG